MPKQLVPDPTWRGPRTLTCTVGDCGAQAIVAGPVIPPDWRESEVGPVCPRHKLVVVVEDTGPDDVLEEALEVERSGSVPRARPGQ